MCVCVCVGGFKEAGERLARILTLSSVLTRSKVSGTREADKWWLFVELNKQRRQLDITECGRGVQMKLPIKPVGPANVV